MQLRVESKELLDAITSVKGAGKYSVASGLKGDSIGDFTFLVQLNDSLEVWNADAGFILRVSIPLVEVSQEDANTVWTQTKDLGVNATLRISEIIPILKKFKGQITIEGGTRLTITDTSSNQFTLNTVKAHPSLDVIHRVSAMNRLIVEEGMPYFNTTQYEGHISMDSKVFTRTMDFCELVGTGIYEIDFMAVSDTPTLESPSVRFSSTDRGRKSYSHELTTEELLHSTGQSATVLFSGPIHKFFKSGTIEFYLKDAFPLLLVGEDRLLIKTPRLEE